MNNFKDLIMQGLSARLDTYENEEEKNMIINLKPRNYLTKKENINNNNINNNKNEFENNINLMTKEILHIHSKIKIIIIIKISWKKIIL